MRIEDGIIKQLTDMGFHRLDIKTRAMDLFYCSDYTGTQIVLILRVVAGSELTSEEYRQIINNTKKRFIESGFSDISLLGLILTASAENAKRFYIDQDDHMIVDLWNRRLIVYEDWSPVFSQLIPKLEDIIHDEAYEIGFEEGKLGSHPLKIQWVTLFNTIIIVAIILIYLLTHHTAIFGEDGLALQRGALSWFFIKEEGEYYRILTSMFLHSDFEHLMNNMLVLFFVGDNLERAAGKVRYLLIYFGSGIIAGISSISYNMMKDRMVLSIGASGAIFGVVGAMAYILLVNKGRLEDISSRQILLLTVFSLYGGVANANIDNVAHIGGFIGGIILAAIFYRRPSKLQVDESL